MKFLICTDVAARGIDVSGVPFGMSYCVSVYHLVFLIVYLVYHLVCLIVYLVYHLVCLIVYLVYHLVCLIAY